MSTRQDKFEPKIIKLKKNVRALSPVLPVVRKLAGGSGKKNEPHYWPFKNQIPILSGFWRVLK